MRVVGSKVNGSAGIVELRKIFPGSLRLQENNSERKSDFVRQNRQNWMATN